MLIQFFQKLLCYCCALMKLNVVLVSAQASSHGFPFKTFNASKWHDVVLLSGCFR